MVNTNKTAIIGLFDNSGSMVQFDTNEFVGSINDIIKEQVNKTEVIFYGATFSDRFKLFADGCNGKDVNIKVDDLYPSGLTAFVPAFARMIRIAGSRFNDMKEEDRPGKVIFILLSDGEQTINYLRNKDIDDSPYEGHLGDINLKKLIEEHENVWKWEFMFMGTSFDSINVGRKIGLKPSKCINFATSDKGLQTVMRCVSNNITRIQKNDTSGFNDSERLESMLN